MLVVAAVEKMLILRTVELLEMVEQAAVEMVEVMMVHLDLRL